eukprot:TRINITY_DN20924_c0_g1_i1.p1 TRINITY_DN20924_c0_g1~~TRINITY_DN20924_c0_g1_i1.p1  ORF type:complete len:486 (-),score=54.09 TRINITY_DN20924_c0_g1_i1:328-1785(-)
MPYGTEAGRSRPSLASWLPLTALLLATAPRLSAAQRRTLFPPRADQPVMDFAPLYLDTLRGSGNFWLVMYYADWCGHCQHFAPTWTKIAQQFKNDSRVTFGALNCAVHQDHCRGVQVPFFPSFSAYNLNNNTESQTKRGFRFNNEMSGPSEAGITDWLRKKLAEIPRAPPAEGSENRSEQTSSSGFKATPQQNISAAVTSTQPRAGASEALQQQKQNDALVALLFAFHQGVFLNAAPVEGEAGTNSTVLRGQALETHLEWLDYLAVSFPQERTRQDLHMLATDTRKAVDRSLQLQHGHGVLTGQVWEALIAQRSLGGVPPLAGKEPEKHLRSCATYTCGLWSLFHILSLIAEADNEVVPLPFDSAPQESDEAESEKGAAQRPVADSRLPTSLRQIKRFVTHFFGCRDCATHFLESFELCDFGVCELSAADVSGAALWLWQKHNAVTRRVASERGLPALPDLWPAHAACPECWNEDGSFDKEGVLS